MRIYTIYSYRNTARSKIILLLCIFALLLTGCHLDMNPSESPGQSTTGNDKSDIQIISKKVFNSLLIDKNMDSVVNEIPYTIDMKSMISVDICEEYLESVEVRFGPTKSITFSQQFLNGEYTVIEYLCDGEIQEFYAYISFDKDQSVAGINFNPPVDETFLEKGTRLVFTTSAGDLPGILETPASRQDKQPLVILIPGSGLIDINGSVGEAKPYRDLSNKLVEKGISVCRYYKRSYYYTQKMDAQKDTVEEEYIEDMNHVINFFVHHSEYAYDSIILLGHSQGGYLLPGYYNLLPDSTKKYVKGLILMGAPFSPLEDILLEQILHMAEEDGFIDTEEQKQVDSTQQEVQKIKNLNQDFDSAPNMLLGLNKYYWVSLTRYDPKLHIHQIHCPCLVMFGNEDLNVPLSEAALWRENSSEKMTIQTFSELNHIFSKSLEGSNVQVSDQVVDTIDEWIHTVIVD